MPGHGDRSMGRTLEQRIRPVKSATHVRPWREYWPRGGPWLTTKNVHQAKPYRGYRSRGMVCGFVCIFFFPLRCVGCMEW